MSPTPDSTFADPQQIIAELRRELADAHRALDERIAASQRNEERYALVSQAVAEGVYDWDIENNALWVSPRLIRIFGLTGISLQAADWNDKIHPNDFEPYRAALRDCFRGTTPRLHCEYRIRLADGEYRWIEDSGLPVRGPSGKVVRLVGAVSDITDRKEAAKALGETNRLKEGLLRDLNAVSETIDYGVLFMGPDLRARVVNRAFRQMWGIPDEFIATGPSMADLMEYNRHNGLYDIPEAEFDAYVASRVKAIQLGNIAPIEMHRADGIILRYEGIVLPDGGRLLTYFDITESKRQEAELREALDQQTATAEVLEVINSSPGDLAPVFDAMLEKATRLCEAAYGQLAMYDGRFFRFVAMHGTAPFMQQQPTEPLRPADGVTWPRIVGGEPLVHIPDVAETDLYRCGHEAALRFVGIGGGRTLLTVALRKDERLLGALTVYRQEVRPFADNQIALLQNFAAQAVIAMENARLLGDLHQRTEDLQQSLEYQTATSDVLKVISRSAFDLQPILDTLSETAARLCAAELAFMTRREGDAYRFITAVGSTAETTADAIRLKETVLDRHSFVAGRGSITGRVIAEAQAMQIVDLASDPEYTLTELTTVGKIQTLLGVPLIREGAVVGTMSLGRQRIEPFTEKQIELVRTFADQAVIAIENARLITETREALERQTATAEVLGVINASPGDLAPVFDEMLQKAMHLCDAAHGVIRTYDGQLFHEAARRGEVEVVRQLRELSGAARGSGPVEPGPDDAFGRLVRGERVVHIADLNTEIGQIDPANRERVDVTGARTWLAVALQKDTLLLGTIILYRREVSPFTEKQIALLQNFAAQAVIAMENARLINETREALEQQTATAEVLQVINSSPSNLAPVFDAIVEKALTLCGADEGGLRTFDGKAFHLVSVRGGAAVAVEQLRHLGSVRPQGGGGFYGRLVHGEPVVHIHDVRETDTYRDNPEARERLELRGIRTWLGVALHKENVLLGALIIHRQEVRPFSDKQIALLESFAAQAVIAMENARLITETREALEQQTATAEVLQVINSSPGDLAPVFDTMLEKAMHLCEGAFGGLWRFDGGRYVSTALRGVPTAFAEFMAKTTLIPGPGSAPYRFLRGERSVLQNVDLADDELYRAGDPQRRALVDLGGARTALHVPLCKDDTALGVITIYRKEVRPFSDKQIALLQNFAAQAVIAMENARLITETREALEQQTATAEVLGVINSSPGDLAPVFDAILDKATDLCEASYGMLYRYEGENFHAIALHAVPEAYAEFLRNPIRVDSRNGLGRLVDGEHLVHLPDIRADGAYLTGDSLRVATLELGCARTLLAVPLRNDEVLLGAIVAYRQEVRPFSDKQIALLQNFAAQAVIAIENARLLDEIRQRQAELRVTFDNMADGVAMFDSALRLTAGNKNFQELLALPDEYLDEHHTFDEYIRYLTKRGEFGAADAEAQIARLRARIGEHYSFERIRPDGTILEIRHNPMPDGGFVLIYSDITERKRSEAEIRAARDAAEAAYRDLKAAQANLIQAEKMASLGQLTAGIAHEIKNPLNFVNNFASLSVELLEDLKETTAPGVAMLDAGQRAEADETMELLTGNLEKIAEHGKRADNIVKSMLEHSRGVTGERREVDFNELVDEALNLAYHGARAQDQSFNISLERNYAPTLKAIELAPQEITRVFLNLFGNGFYAANKRAKENGNASYRPTLNVATRETEDGVEVTVRDNGVGIPPEIRDKLFQPFFTTKPTGEGTGLGLSISYDIITQQHGGTITVESEPGSFTEFTVRLPRH